MKQKIYFKEAVIGATVLMVLLILLCKI